MRLFLGLLRLGNDLLSKLAVGVQACTGGDELTDDDVLLQTNKVVDLTLDGGFSQDLCGLLEGRGGHPAVGRKRGLRDTHEQLRGNGFLQRLAGLGVDLARGIARADLLVGILILKQIDHGAGEQVRVTGLLDAHLAHHLADDDLDMLIVDVNALLTVNLQNFLNEVVMNGGRAADTQDIVRGQRAVLQLRALGDDVAVVHAQAGVRHRVDAVVAVVRGDDDVEQAALGRLFEADLTADLGEGRHLLGTARLKQFLDSRKTLGDIAARNAAGVEGSHRQLRTGLADGLGRDDTDRLAGADGLAVFVDHGLLRKNEGDEVEAVFGPNGNYDLHFIRVNAQERFYSKLAGVSEPEHKRKIIGEEFIRVFEEEAKKIGAVDFLVQGTIYPDVVESGLGGESAVIKSHHNVGGLPDYVDFKEIIEPLRNLFKDEVRKVGLELGIPEHLVFRQPFPGPGLGIRIIGEVTAEKVKIVQDADAIYREEIANAGLDREINQYFAALTNMRSVGVMGDERTYDYAIALRAVKTIDFMTAESAQIPYEVLQKVTSRIINEVSHVNRVMYDITSKPPGTIEFE